VVVFIVLAALAAVLIILRAWHLPPFNGALESTENAYVRGRTTVVAPQVSGYVVEVGVTDYSTVQGGQVLVRIDDRIYTARVQQARASLDAQIAALNNNEQAHAARRAQLTGQQAALENAKAQLVRAQSDMKRVDGLVKDGSVSVRERDQTLAALAQAQAAVRQAQAGSDVARQDIRTVEVGKSALQAQVEVAKAQLNLAQIDLEHCVIRAPEAGQTGEIGVRLGQYVTNGTQLLSLVPNDRWVIADYKEAQTANMAVGERASVTVDALAGARLMGVVKLLSPAAGSEFAVIKPDNATGNFVKVPQRIGVLIVLDPDQKLLARLRPGMSVEASVDTASGQR
jgi:multidrug resistance efflux pump